MEEYDAIMRRHLEELRGQGITHAVFGDIFLEDLRRYREERLAEVGLTAVFPLWQIPTGELARRFVADGFHAYTVCVNDKMLGRPYVGREMDAAFFASLPATVDPCGENGEYHSFVYAGPIFHRPIPCRLGQIVQRSLGPDNETYDTRFWYADLQ